MQAGVFTIPRSDLNGRMLRPRRAHSSIDQRVVAPFFAGPENRLADVAWQWILGEGPLESSRCPLVIYGPPGTGKTHLASGLAAAWRQSDRRRQAHCGTAAKIAWVDNDNRLKDDAATSAAPASMFVVEDLHEISKHSAAQQRLRLLIDRVETSGGQVMVTSRVSPRVLRGLQAGLRSRLSGGLIVALRSASYETRVAMIEAFAAAVDSGISPAAANVLARRDDLSPGCLSGLISNLAKLAAKANDRQPVIDEPAVRVAVGDSSIGGLRIHNIAVAAAKRFGLTVADLKGRSRRRHVTNVRCITMYLAWKKGRYSLKKIGHYLGGRDHSTVLHGCRKVEQLLSEEPATQHWIDEILDRLR
ncbi:MAG: helix-turn-helix domain-containing protein [Pirellulales bacterium]